MVSEQWRDNEIWGEYMITDNFMSLVNEYYSKSRDEMNGTRFENNVMTWTGKVVDSLSKSIVVYAGNGEVKQGWHNQDAKTLPYIFFARFNDQVDGSTFSIGDTITIKGKLTAKGDKEFARHWRLSECEIIEVNA